VVAGVAVAGQPPHTAHHHRCAGVPEGLVLSAPWGATVSDPATSVLPAGRLKSLRQRADAAFRAAPSIAALGGVVLLVLLKIPWPAPFDVLGSDNAETVGFVIVVTILAELAQKQQELEGHQRQLADQQGHLLDQVSQRLTDHDQELASRLTLIADQQKALAGMLSPSANRARRYFRNPVEVYSVLGPIAAQINNESEKRLDIMGTTLSGAWAALSSWLERPEAVGWRVRVASFSDVSGRLDPWIDPSWPMRPRHMSGWPVAQRHRPISGAGASRSTCTSTTSFRPFAAPDWAMVTWSSRSCPGNVMVKPARRATVTSTSPTTRKPLVPSCSESSSRRGSTARCAPRGNRRPPGSYQHKGRPAVPDQAQRAAGTTIRSLTPDSPDQRRAGQSEDSRVIAEASRRGPADQVRAGSG
jgi:hypothetical protein